MPKTISRAVSIANAIQTLGSERNSMIFCRSARPCERCVANSHPIAGLQQPGQPFKRKAAPSAGAAGERGSAKDKRRGG